MLKEVHGALKIEEFTLCRELNYKEFEGNDGCIELDKHHKFLFRTKHIGIKHHHFHIRLADGTVLVLHIDILEQ